MNLSKFKTKRRDGKWGEKYTFGTLMEKAFTKVKKMQSQSKCMSVNVQRMTKLKPQRI